MQDGMASLGGHAHGTDRAVPGSGLRPGRVVSTRRRGSSGSARRAAGALLITLALAGCGAASTPVPEPTATSTPTLAPSPTPNVGELFIKQMVAAQSGSMVLDGEMTISGINAPLSGSMQFSGQDQQSLMTVTMSGTAQVTEKVRQGGASWTRTDPGPWLVDDAPSDNSTSVVAQLQALSGLEDAGVEPFRGTPAHRLRPPAGEAFPPEAFGFDDPSITNPAITVEFLAAADGTPLAMEMTGTWSQASQGVELAVSITMTFTFNWTLPVSITAPDDVWAVHASPLGYSMAHPADWTVAETADGEDFQFQGESLVYVRLQDLPGTMTAEQFRDELVKAYAVDFGTPPASDGAVKLGGQAAHLLTYRITVEGGVNVLFDYVSVRGDQGWEVFMVTADGPGLAADLGLLQTFAATFAFTD